MLLRMIGADWCEKCQQAKRIIQERGLWDLVEYVDYEQPEGRQLAAELGAEYIPFFEEDGQIFEYVGAFLHRLMEEKLFRDHTKGEDIQ